MMKSLGSQIVRAIKFNQLGYLRIMKAGFMTTKSIKIAPFGITNMQFNNRLYFSSQQQSPKSLQTIQKQLQQIERTQGQNSMQYLQKLHQISFEYGRQGKYPQAISKYQQIVKKFKQNINDPQSPAVGDTLKNLQMLYKRAGKFIELIPLTMELIKIRQKELGLQHKTVANEYNQLGMGYYYIENYEQAITHYEHALKIRQKLFGQKSLEFIEVKNNLATAFYSKQEINKAKEIFVQNIKALKQLPNFNQRMIINPLSNLAVILQKQGNLSEALRKYEQIMEILKRVQQKNSPFVAAMYHNMGMVCLKMMNIHKAEQYHSKSLEINKELHTQNHPAVAQNLHNLAACYSQKGEFQKSLQTYNKSIQIRKRTLGPNNTSLIESFNRTGIIYKFLGKFNQARSQFQQALKILRSHNPEENKTQIFGDVYMQIGTTYVDERAPQKGVEFLQKAQKNYRLLFDEKHPKFSQLYFTKAKVQFIFSKNYQRARQLLSKSIEIDQKYFPVHPNLYIKYSMTGSCLYEQRKYNEAIQFYNKSQKSLKQSGKGSSQQVVANEGLLSFQVASAYIQLKQLTKAQQKLNRAIQIFQKHFPQSYQTLLQFYFSLGTVKRGLGQKDKSREWLVKSNECLSKLLEQVPNHPLLLKKREEILNYLNN